MSAFRKLSYGLFIISVNEGERHSGCICNTVVQLTSSPNQVSLTLNKANYTTGVLQKTKKCNVSILAENAPFALFERFGFQSGRDVDKFEGISYENVEGVPVIADGCGYVVCKLIDKMETSTHTVFLGEIIAGETGSKSEPMTYAYYHNVIKGKSPKNAPTYIPEETKAEPECNVKVKHVCSVCGFEYCGDPLPEGYTCPVCRQPASVFKRVEE